MNPTDTTTTRPLAERITQGPYAQFQVNGPVRIGNLRNEQIAIITDKIHDQREAVANGSLILETFNVTHETRKTPRQLADELNAALLKLADLVTEKHDLMDALKGLLYAPLDGGISTSDAIDEATSILKRLKP